MGLRSIIIISAELAPCLIIILGAALSSASAFAMGSGFHVIAGNTNPGTGGSAKSALFFNDLADQQIPDSGSIAADSHGVLYFRDTLRGVLYVDPATGLQKTLAPMTGVSSGDGGSVFSATLNVPLRIAIDSQDRLLIFDYDRIRRVDAFSSSATPTIHTIIGGGNSFADGIPALQVQFDPRVSGYSGGSTFDNIGPYVNLFALIPLPNGNIYFISDNIGNQIEGGWRIRVYNASNGTVSSIYPSGEGAYGYPSQGIGGCTINYFAMSFSTANSAPTAMQLIPANDPNYCPVGDLAGVSLDPSSGLDIAPNTQAPDYGWRAGAMTGNDGNMYFADRANAGLYKFSSGTWIRVLGSGTVGNCVDGTPANSCALDLNDAFVSAQGKITFADHGLIRTVDSNGNILTLMGETLDYGDGGSALNARFNQIDFVDHGKNGEVIVLDKREGVFRSFVAGGNIGGLAGNGLNESASDLSELAAGNPIPFQDNIGFVANPANGDIFYYRWLTNNEGPQFVRLDRASGKWFPIAGGGATSYVSGDGKAGSSLLFDGELPSIFGFDGAHILANVDQWNGSQDNNTFFKDYSISDGTQSAVAGVPGMNANDKLCADGTATSSCNVPNQAMQRAFYDGSNKRWIMIDFINAPNVVRTLTLGGKVGTLMTLAHPAVSFAYAGSGTGGGNTLYYCGADGLLRQVKSAPGSKESTLVWTDSSIACSGKTMSYDSSTKSVVFPFTQNGLMGIAGYSLGGSMNLPGAGPAPQPTRTPDGHSGAADGGGGRTGNVRINFN